jgi:hypothetical protein
VQGGVRKEANIRDHREGNDLVLIRIERNVVIDEQERVSQATEVGHGHAAEIGDARPQREAE